MLGVKLPIFEHPIEIQMCFMDFIIMFFWIFCLKHIFFTHLWRCIHSRAWPWLVNLGARCFHPMFCPGFLFSFVCCVAQCRCCLAFWCVRVWSRAPSLKRTSRPEDRPKPERDVSLPTTIFQGAGAVRFRECNTWKHKTLKHMLLSLLPWEIHHVERCNFLWKWCESFPEDAMKLIRYTGWFHLYHWFTPCCEANEFMSGNFAVENVLLGDMSDMLCKSIPIGV